MRQRERLVAEVNLRFAAIRAILPDMSCPLAAIASLALALLVVVGVGPRLVRGAGGAGGAGCAQ